MGRMGKKVKTDLIHIGIDPDQHFGSINDPIYKNSTLIFKDYRAFLEAKKNKFQLPYYGRIGTYTTRSLEKIISTLYKSKFTVLTSSGLSAITLTLKSFLEKNDEVLITENCYEPVFNFAKYELSKSGVKIHYYPNNYKNLQKLVNNKTKLIYVESPGSLNFNVEDLKFITKFAKKNKLISVIDNTWSTFLGCNPLNHGFDIVIESGTKYLSGHSDNFLGIITTKSKIFYKQIKKTTVRYGDFVSSESCFSALKGLKTLVRMNLIAKMLLKFLKYYNLKKSKLLNIFQIRKIKIINYGKISSINNGLITLQLKKKVKLKIY